VIRAHKIRLHPTAEQADYFVRAAGTARFAFNWGLARWTEAQEAGNRASVRVLKKSFNALADEQFPWVCDVTRSVIEGAFMDLGRAIARFKQAQANGLQAALPRFKSKKRSKFSFYLATDQFKVGDHWVDIPGAGHVNMAEKLRFAGDVLSARISKGADDWFVSILIDVPEAPKLSKNPSTSLDAWLNWLGTFGDGWRFENQETLVNLLKRVQRMSRAMGRKQKGSKNYEEARLKLARLNVRVTNTRDDIFQKLTAAMIRSCELAGVEDLHVNGMLNNRHWTRAKQEAGDWFDLLEAKLSAAGDRMQVGRFFPHSRRCSVCHALRKDSLRADGVFVCTRCGFEADQALNDSLNMIQEALRHD